MTVAEAAAVVTPAGEPDVVKRRDKSINAIWKLGERVRDPGGQFAKTIEACAELHVSHDRDRKQFYATLNVCDHDGGMVSVRPFDVLYVEAESVGRFSAKRLEAFYESALATLRANAGDPRVVAKFAGTHEMANPNRL